MLTLSGRVQSHGASDGAKPLRVVLVSSSSGSRGGGEFYLSGLASGLTSLGHSVTSVLSDHVRMDELASLLKNQGAVLRLPYRNTYDRRMRNLGALWARGDIKRVGRELAALRPDVIHINKQNLEDGLDLLVSATETGYPTVVTVHVTRTMRQLGAVLGRARDWVSVRVLRGLSCPLIATARSGIADLIGLGIGEDRLNLVRNGVMRVRRVTARRREAPGAVAPITWFWGVWPGPSRKKTRCSCCRSSRSCLRMSALSGSGMAHCWNRCVAAPPNWA